MSDFIINDEPVIEYRVTLYNRKHDRKEVYITKAINMIELQSNLSLFLENGYSFIEAIATDRIDEYEPNEAEYEAYLKLVAELHKDLLKE